MGLVIGYKKWVINQRMKELQKFLKLFPDSELTPKRQQELRSLELDLEDLDD